MKKDFGLCVGVLLFLHSFLRTKAAKNKVAKHPANGLLLSLLVGTIKAQRTFLYLEKLPRYAVHNENQLFGGTLNGGFYVSMSVLTPREASIEFQMGVSAIYTNLHSKKIPSIRIGRIFRVIPDGFFEQDLSLVFPSKLKSRDICTILKISLPTVYKLIDDGAFPGEYYGRALRIPRDGFFQWLRHGSVKPAKQIAVMEVSDFIDNIILKQDGGFYHG